MIEEVNHQAVEKPADLAKADRYGEEGQRQEAGVAVGRQRRRRSALRRHPARVSARRWTKPRLRVPTHGERQRDGGGACRSRARARIRRPQRPALGHPDRQDGARRRPRLRTEPGARKGRHRHPAPARRHGRSAILGRVPTDRRPHPARTALEQIDLIRRIEEAHPDVFLPGAERPADYARAQGRRKDRLVHRGRGRRRPGKFAEPSPDSGMRPESG